MTCLKGMGIWESATLLGLKAVTFKPLIVTAPMHSP